jgi:hypothetical protein
MSTTSIARLKDIGDEQAARVVVVRRNLRAELVERARMVRAESLSAMCLS